MATLNPSSELDAVNMALQAIGENPVATLSAPQPADVAIAQSIFQQVNSEVQAHGWHFNTLYDYPITADASGYLNLPTTPPTLRADADPRQVFSYDVCVRGTKFYNIKDATDVFTVGSVIYSEIVQLLDFDQIPFAARYFIAVKAARIFSDRVQGAGNVHAYTSQDEMRAWALLKEAEDDTADHTIFDHYDTFRTLDRRI